jgi:hypothetical protein
MYVAEQITSVAEQSASEADELPQVADTPLQIRMNPFIAAAKRTPLFDARIYLVERAASIGRLNLFTQEASNLAIEGSRGLPRDLRGIAQFAFFAAASEGSSQIDSRHVAIAIETWIAQNEGADVKARAAETTLRAIAKAADDSLQAPAAFENESAVAAPPASDTKAPGADATGMSSSLIRRQVLSFIEAEARKASVETPLPKRHWVRRSVEMTAAFLALFAFFGAISAQMTNGNSNGAKRAFAVQVQQADLTAAVVEPPAAPPSKPLKQAPAKTETARDVAIAHPAAATPVDRPVENAAAGNPVLDVQDQVPTEDHIKSETP